MFLNSNFSHKSSLDIGRSNITIETYKLNDEKTLPHFINNVVIYYC